MIIDVEGLMGQRALKYLRYTEKPSKEQLELLFSSFSEIQEVEMIESAHKYFQLELCDGKYALKDSQINIDYPPIQNMLGKKKSDSVCIFLSTLGIGVDRRIESYKDSNPSRMLLLDACASSYIESVTDEYQRSLGLGDETFRYAPGYGKVPLIMQKEIFESISEFRKLHVELDENCIMHPFKSMTGLVGFRSKEGRI